MPRVLTVSEVRKAIYLAAGGLRAPGPGEASTALLGYLFHETFQRLTGPDPQFNFVRPLERADRNPSSWEGQLTEHAYLWCVGPQLMKYQGDLQGSPEQVLFYWKAVQNLCRWLSEVLLKQIQPAQAIEEVRRYIFAENELECEAELSDPEWTDRVILQGRIDAVLRQPATGLRCAVEIKLGRTHPEADLAQACLYHLLLAAKDRSKEGQALALFTFQPEIHERVLKPGELAEAQKYLKDLIGRLAQVKGIEGIKVEPGKFPSGKKGEEKLGEMAHRLLASFEEFGAPVQLEGEPLIGPAFYRFLAKPEKRIRADKILNMATTIWPRLQTDQPPQMAMEHGLITIDVQRPDREVLHWHPGLSPDTAPEIGGSRFPVGMTVEGQWKVADLTEPEHSHFLVAGTTGSGKSEWLKMAVGSLCAANGPATLSLVLIDPKRTAFSLLAASPFLRRPIVFPADEDPLSVLDELIQQMEDRYALFEKMRIDDLKKYNATHSQPLPRIVCVCDEYGDLILADSQKGKEVERRIGRLGTKGRAAGIHLILATQRPTKDIVKGIIKANLNARVALKVNERLESRIILEQNGAETLLGKGDLLFKDLGQAIRLQAPLISDADMRKAARC